MVGQTSYRTAITARSTRMELLKNKQTKKTDQGRSVTHPLNLLGLGN